MKLLNIFITPNGNLQANILCDRYGIERERSYSVVTYTCEESNLAFLTECENVTELDFDEYVGLKVSYDDKKHDFKRIDDGIGFIDMLNYNETKDICNDLN